MILGQDPYYNKGQACGLAFSVPKGIAVPPSLENIFKEISTDLPLNFKSRPNHGCLEGWCSQGVLLLNTCLSVRENLPNSHSVIGWERFTDAVIVSLANKKNGKIVFLLWGNHAIKKESVIRTSIDNNHLILKAPHPSPLSAHRGFFGCKHFSQTNNFLMKNNQKSIDWSFLP